MSIFTPLPAPKPANAPQVFDEHQRQQAVASAQPPAGCPRLCTAFETIEMPSENATDACYCAACAVYATHKMVTLNTGTRKQARVGCAL